MKELKKGDESTGETQTDHPPSRSKVRKNAEFSALCRRFDTDFEPLERNFACLLVTFRLTHSDAIERNRAFDNNHLSLFSGLDSHQPLGGALL